MTLLSATALDLPALTELFNACFSDYAVTMRMDDQALSEHIENNGIDLDCSRVVVEKRPVAFALIARRGEAGWVGGMGTLGSHRGRGVGRNVLVSGIEAAHERGCTSLWLEVIDSNRTAAQLYAKLGFEVQRQLTVWSLPATKRIHRLPIRPARTQRTDGSSPIDVVGSHGNGPTRLWPRCATEERG